MCPESSRNRWAPSAGKPENWLTPGRFAAGLVVLIFTAFPGVLLGWETFVFRDYGKYGYPVAHYFRESIWRGEVPLWNPLNNCGIPFAAQWGPMVFYPLSLFYLLLPLSWSLSVFCLLHLFWAGLGMYFLAERWTGSRFGAGVAGLAFAFNGLSLCCLVWPNYLAVLGWMPWVVLTVERAWQEGGHRLIWAVGASGMQMLGGVPELILFTWFAVGVQWISQCLDRQRPFRVMLSRMALVVVLTTGLAAVQLFPFFQLLAHSQRDSGFKGSHWAMPGTGWANLLVPLFHCFRGPLGVFFQKDQAMFTSYYLGSAILLLAILAAGRVRNKRVYGLAALAGLGLILALGRNGYLYSWLWQVFYPLKLMRYPIKFVFLPAFAVPILAAFGIRELGAAKPIARSFLTWAWAVLIGLMFLVVGFAYFYPMSNEEWIATLRNGLARGAFLTLIVAALFFLNPMTNSRRRCIFEGGTLLLIWIDLLTHVPNQNPTVSPSVYQPGFVAFHQMDPQPTPGRSRAMRNRDAMINFLMKSADTPFNDYLCQRLVLAFNCNLLNDIPIVDGFYTLYLREQNALQPCVFASPVALHAGLADYLGVCQTTKPGSDFDWTARPSYRPLITGGQQPVFSSALDTIYGLQQSTFDPRRTIYLPLEAKPSLGLIGAAKVSIRSERFNAHHLEFEVQTAHSSMVSIAQSFYPPWHAYVDGQRTKLWPANYAFQALAVPTGRHQVMLVYEDWFFRVGAVISILTLAGCLGMGLWYLPLASRSVKSPGDGVAANRDPLGHSG